MLTGLLYAVGAMVLNSIAGLVQSAAAQAEGLRGSLLTQRRYLVGLGIDGLGWVCTVVALRHIPVFAVQAVLGVAIAATAVATRALNGSRLAPLERAAVGACLIGLGLVAASVGRGDPEPASPSIVLGLFIGAAVLASILTLLSAEHRERPAVMSVIAGLGFGGTSLAVRAAPAHTGSFLGAGGLAAQPTTYLVLGFWVIGLIGYLRALRIGAITRVTALLQVTEVIVPGILGIALLGDSVRAGWWLGLVVGLGLAAAGGAVFCGQPNRVAVHPHRTTSGSPDDRRGANVPPG